MEEGAIWGLHFLDFDFAVDIIALTSAKLRKLRNQLQELRQGKKIPRQQLQQCLGLLVWATSIEPHLRPFMAPLYRDPHSPPGTCMRSTPISGASSWTRLPQTSRSASRARDSSSHALQARVLEYGGRRVFTKTDIPVVPKSSKPQFIRASNPRKLHYQPAEGQQRVLGLAAGHFFQLFLAPAGRFALPHLSSSSRRQSRW